MIIERIEASGFMKFDEIVLDKIPVRGVIGIFGENESGKSSMGDAIAFALYGITPRCSSEDISRVIKWGAGKCRVSLVFSQGNARYRVERQLNIAGEKTALLEELNGKTLTMDWEQASDSISRITSLDFRSFRYTSLLAQKEIGMIRSNPEDRSAVVDSLVGAGLIRKARNILRQKSNEYRSRISECESEMAELDSREDILRQELEGRDDYISRIAELEKRERDEKTILADLENELEILHHGLESKVRLQNYNDQIVTIRKNMSELDETTGQSTDTLLEIAASCFFVNAEKIDQIIPACEQVAEKTATRLAMQREKVKSIHRTLEMTREAEALEQLISVQSESLAMFENRTRSLSEIREELNSLKDNLKLKKADEIAIHEKNLKKLNRIKTLSMDLKSTSEKFLDEMEKTRNTVNSEIDNFKTIITNLPEKLSELNQASEIAVISHEKTHGKFLLALLLSIITFLATAYFHAISLYAAKFIWIPAAILSATTFWLGFKRKKARQNLDMICERENSAREEIRKRKNELETVHNEKENELIRIMDTEAWIRNWDYTSPDTLANSIEKEDDAVRLFTSNPDNSSLISAYLAEIAQSPIPPEYLSWSQIDNPMELSFSDIVNNLQDRELELEQLIASEEEVVRKRDTIKTRLEELESRLSELKHRLKSYGNINTHEVLIEAENTIDELEETIASQREAMVSIQFHLSRISEHRKETAALSGELNFHKTKRDSLLDEWEKRNHPVATPLQLQESQAIEKKESIEKIKSEILDTKEKKSRLTGELTRFDHSLKSLSTIRNQRDAIREELRIHYSKERAIPEALSALDEAEGRIRRGVLPIISDYLGKVLYTITSERYRIVDVDGNLDIRVFIPEKGDYAPLKSLSGGTEDQLLLALRLAFAKTLLPGGQGGFLFLDEPLSSFDQRRRESFMAFLKHLESTFAQVFLISHISGLERFMDTHIILSRDSAILTPGPLSL